jgi:hypothetical protein
VVDRVHGKVKPAEILGVAYFQRVEGDVGFRGIEPISVCTAEALEHRERRCRRVDIEGPVALISRNVEREEQRNQIGEMVEMGVREEERVHLEGGNPMRTKLLQSPRPDVDNDTLIVVA